MKELKNRNGLVWLDFKKFTARVWPRGRKGNIKSLFDFICIIDFAGKFQFEWNWNPGRVELGKSYANRLVRNSPCLV